MIWIIFLIIVVLCQMLFSDAMGAAKANEYRFTCRNTIQLVLVIILGILTLMYIRPDCPIIETYNIWEGIK